MDIYLVNEVVKNSRMSYLSYRAFFFLGLILLPDILGSFGYGDNENLRRLCYLLLGVYLLWASRTISVTEVEHLRLKTEGDSLEIYKYGALQNTMNRKDIACVRVKKRPILGDQLLIEDKSRFEYTYSIPKDNKVLVEELEKINTQYRITKSSN